MASKLAANAKKCPRTENACIYLGCAKVAGICLIAQPEKIVTFKRASKLLPSPSKAHPGKKAEPKSRGKKK